MTTYQEFLASKIQDSQPVGFDVPIGKLNPALFDWQKCVVQWALRRGRAALFEDCGLGKTFQQLEWAHHVSLKAGPVLILTPLAVAQQTLAEALKFDMHDARVVHTQAECGPGINITNYEKLHHFEPGAFAGVVLDESSILKAFDGSTRKQITEFARAIHYRLACTATPAPNDYMELGTHAEFLDIMSHTEMLATFFVHDGGDTSKWRLKGHAQSEFWKWMASWSVGIRFPSDIGFNDEGYILPKLHIHQRTVESGPTDGYLFTVEAKTLEDRRAARADSLEDRVKECAALVNDSDEQWLVWCNLNAESEALSRAIHDAIEVKGSDSAEHKEYSLMAFAEGKIRVLVTKPTIAGFGMNFQRCSNMAFVGLSDSYEQFYQAVRRCWRFGQTRPVQCYVITAETEGAVVRNIERKEKQAKEMMDGMVEHMQDQMKKNLGTASRERDEYVTEWRNGDRWRAFRGDVVDGIQQIESESIGYSIFSPPFASLYTYSNSERDMGNVKDNDEFAEHFGFLVPELYRVLVPGRLVSFHCMNLPATIERDGFIGVKDFRGELIRIFEKAGFIFHSEVCIWKDPVTAMQRTKAIGLLYKQLKKDSAISRQGLPDYLVTMRKPGANPSPVTKTPESFPVGLWQRYASPVWMDIDPYDTLQYRSAREDDDERHICPLQLEVIRRGVRLWSNEDDTVLSPFMGIASEGVVAVEMGRRFVGFELKGSYYGQAVRNLEHAEAHRQVGLFEAE